MRMRMAMTKTAAAVLCIGTLAGLSSCEGTLPKPSAPVNARQTPDLTQAQEQRTRQRILSALDKANESRDVEGLDAILSGPALQIRTSELSIAKATVSLDPKTTIPEEITQTVIPTDAGWPRSLYAITTTTQDQQSKRLLVLRQDSARGNYKLWAVARLFQGAQLPKFAVPDHGAQMGDVADSGLVATPQQAVDRYADLLQNGDASKYAADFEDDYFRQELTQLAQTVQEGMERNHGSQQQSFAAVKDGLVVMRSSDGGDLVVAQIGSQWTRQAGEGRESQPASDAERALFAGGSATSTMRVTYVNVVALYIPPADSGGRIVAVGAERQPVKVEAL